MKLEIRNLTRRPLPKTLFWKIIKSVEKLFPKLKNQSISLALVGFKKITALNRIYRQKNYPTDTISFAFNESKKFPGQNQLGEIFLCLPHIQKQAKKNSRPFADELRFVFTHSLLHLLGYDHHTDKEEGKMNRLTEKILKK